MSHPQFSESSRVSMTCAICSIPFVVAPNRASSAKYCSRACHGRARTIAAENRPNPTKTCPQCGVTFSQCNPAKLSAVTYCSAACGHASRRGRPSGRANRIEKQCVICGESFTVNKSRESSAKYCSHKCRIDGMTGVRIKVGGKFRGPRSAYVMVYLPDDPMANSRGAVYEHRLVARDMVLGRPLKPGEVVHHKDRDGTNNEPSNLQVMTQAEHAALHKSEGW